MRRSPTLVRDTRSRSAPARSRRGWLTLLLVLIAAVVLGVGPAQLSEMLSGLVYQRPPAATVAPAPIREDAVLQASIDTVSLASGHLSMQAIDLETGATAGVDPARTVLAASLFKVPILLEVLVEEDAGQLDPNRQLEIRQEDWTDGSGVLQARVGDRLSVRDLTRLMIEQSDNIAALVLLDVTGVESVNALALQLGMTTTHLVDHRAGEDGDHTTSAEDMARLFQQLATGQVVNQRVSEEALSLLELKQSQAWLGEELPFWVKVAHKWGDLPEARNDAGVVYTPRGSYVIAVLTENAPPDEAAIAIAQASRAAYDYLGRR